MSGKGWRLDFSERQEKLKHRLLEIQEKVQDSFCFTFDRMFQERMDTYFVMEEKLQEFEKLFAQLSQELSHTAGLKPMENLEKRFYYLEDSFEELDAGIRERPARYRHRFGFSDFFRRWQEQGDAPDIQSEIRDIEEAYEVLNISPGSDMKTVTAAYRQLVKLLHPDGRNGDRSEEDRLRKIVAAYQFIKNQKKRKSHHA